MCRQSDSRLGTLFLIIDDSFLSREDEIEPVAEVGVVGVGDGERLEVVEGFEVLMWEVLVGRGSIDVK